MGAVTGAGMSEAELTGEDKDIGGLLDDVETGTAFGAGFGDESEAVLSVNKASKTASDSSPNPSKAPSAIAR